jgi:N-acetylmuramoyl-L-alanine amidase
VNGVKPTPAAPRLLAALAALCTLSVGEARAAPPDGPLVVVIDPGHGGAFPHDGAHGPRGMVEKAVTLQVSRRLKSVLEDAGATVLLTRDEDTDVSYADRVRIANEAGADVFVSVHCNSMATPRDRAVTRGAETYFLSLDPTDAEARLLAELENGGPDALPAPKATNAVTGLLADLALGQARSDSAALAQTLHRNLVRRTGTQSRGVRQAPFLVLSGTKMPAALVEIGFISHPAEAKLLAKEKHQQKVAEALAAGIQEFNQQVLARRLFPPTPEQKAELAAQRTAWAKSVKEKAKGAVAAATGGPLAPPAAPAPAVEAPAAPAAAPEAPAPDAAPGAPPPSGAP